VLFCDTALAMQVPYSRPDAPIASYTISTAQEAGWMWDIALENRRGIGYVYSSAHTDDERAEQVLRAYVGEPAAGLTARKIGFNAGYREINWQKNCIAIGLSSGFFEPLEATGIMFSEIAAVSLSNLFPWGGDLEIAAKQFNERMRRRYERALDFIKLHYCLTERRDTGFWNDNVEPAGIPDSLQERLRCWRHRPPGSIDIDANRDIFPESSWQYVLYGMGYRTDLTPRAPLLKYYEEARQAFAEIRRQADTAVRTLPTNRQLLDAVRSAPRNDGPPGHLTAHASRRSGPLRSNQEDRHRRRRHGRLDGCRRALPHDRARRGVRDADRVRRDRHGRRRRGDHPVDPRVQRTARAR
jgi:hypothetical protein